MSRYSANKNYILIIWQKSSILPSMLIGWVVCWFVGIFAPTGPNLKDICITLIIYILLLVRTWRGVTARSRTSQKPLSLTSGDNSNSHTSVKTYPNLVYCGTSM